MLRQTKIGKTLALVVFTALALTSSSAVLAAAGGNGVEVTATVDRNQLGPDDTFTFTVTVSSSEDVAVSQPTLPPINDFEILNEWHSQESHAVFEGSRKGVRRKIIQSTKYNFMLQPKREGTLSIGGVEVVIDGHSHVTRPIQIKVAAGLGGSQSQGGGQNPGGQNQLPNSGVQMPQGFSNDDDQDDLFSQLLRRGMGMGADPTELQGGSRTLPINPNDAFFVQVDTDKTEAYVGEQVTVSFYLYTRGNIRDLDTLKYPSLRGFWKEDIEIATHLNFSNEVVNGIPYKKALLAAFALFPIKEGPATIDSYMAKCTVLPGFDNFGTPGSGQAFTYTKTSLPVKINVKPLPKEGQPADFSGAVGDFQVSSSVEDHNIVSNQPFKFKVRFEGKGNAKLIELPPFQPPEGVEQYDIQKDSKFFRTGTSYKDFTIQLIPRREGEFVIPAISVAIFDPSRKAYVQKTTEPVRVLVSAGTGPQAGGQMMKDGGGTGGGTGAQAAKANLPPEILTQERQPWLITQAQFSFLFPVMFLLGLAALGWKARRELGWGEKKADLQRRLRARLRRVDAKVANGDWRGVGVEMTNAVYFVLGEISGEGGANAEFEKVMKKAPPSVRRELSVPLAKQMELFQVLSFAPENVVGDLKNPERLKAAVSEMSQLMEKAVNLGMASGQTGAETVESAT